MGEHREQRYRPRTSQRRTVERKVYFDSNEFALVLVAAGRADLKPGAWISQTACRVAKLQHDGIPSDWDKLERVARALEGAQESLSGIAVRAAEIAATQRDRSRDVSTEAHQVFVAARRAVWQLDDLLVVVRRVLG